MHIFNSTGISLYQDDIIDSEGCYVIDSNGNKYLDLEAGVWCLPLGHKHPHIVKCIKQQVDKISHVNYRYNHKIVEKVACKLIEITEIKNGKSVFLSSGSEAVDYSIHIAKKLHPNKKCICLSNQYLSAYGFGANTNTQNWIKVQWSYRDNKSEDEWLKVLSDINFKEVGIFVFEAGNSSGLTKLPPINLVRVLAKKIRDENGIIVVDEVTCGIGRTGQWFGYMHYGLKPDIITIGKGLGNGYPISAIVMRDEIAIALQRTSFKYAQSHQNDPLGCRIAYEVLIFIEQNNLLEDVKFLGVYLRDKCNQLIGDNTIIKEVRGIGLMNCIQFLDIITYQEMINIEKYFFNKNMIVGVNPSEKCLRVYMPFIIKKEMIDNFILALYNLNKRWKKN